MSINASLSLTACSRNCMELVLWYCGVSDKNCAFMPMPIRPNVLCEHMPDALVVV